MLIHEWADRHLFFDFVFVSDCKGIDLFEILTELNKLNKSDDGLETVVRT